MIALRRGFKTWCENAARGYRRELELAPVAPARSRTLRGHRGITIWTPGRYPGLQLKGCLPPDGGRTRKLVCGNSLRDGDVSLIIINNGHALTRQNNSIAHEIGHIALRHEPATMYVTETAS